MSQFELSDEQRIQGNWRAVTVETLGYPPANAEWGADDKLTVSGDRVATPSGSTFRLRLDPTADPKQLDLLDAHTGRVQFHGIYAFQGERLITCVATAATPRPLSFVTSKSVTNMITHYDRVNR